MLTDTILSTNRTATTDGPISLARTAGLGKYVYGNGFTVMERISGTVLISTNSGKLSVPQFDTKTKPHI